MPPQEQPIMQQEEQTLTIMQINLNKSEKAHLDIINEDVSQKYDIILVQEPHVTTFNKVRSPANFRTVFPINRLPDDDKIRSVIWVNGKLDTKNWKILDFPETNDIMAIQMEGPYGKLAIFNIYNDCAHSRNERALGSYI
jgi:hypothetical protein